MIRIGILVCIALFSLTVFGQETTVVEKKTPAKANARPADEKKPAEEPYDKATAAEMEKCVAFDTASGLIEVEMFPAIAPITVRNFLNLTAIKAFDNTTFSRVVPGFVIQGGNLYSNKNITYDLAVRAHKTIQDEPNMVRHVSGIISMARGDEANSASTSFFILLREATTLDNKFAAFGKVVTGMDVVEAINKMPVEGETPKEPVLIKTAKVVECGKRLMTEN
jgi:cyclophilin family peptidyl-prolyl cis-trans isomerase